MMENKVSVFTEESRTANVECPVCGREAELREIVYELPNVGRTLMVSFSCPYCGYRKSDVVPLQVRRRRRIYYRVEGIEDLNARVVRSSVATIEIPELGISITPGLAGQFVITNIEGVLRLVQDAAKSIEVLENTASGFTDFIERLIKEGGKFTMIIDDPWGVSVIEPPRESGGCKLLIEEVSEEGYA